MRCIDKMNPSYESSGHLKRGYPKKMVPLHVREEEWVSCCMYCKWIRQFQWCSSVSTKYSSSDLHSCQEFSRRTRTCSSIGEQPTRVCHTVTVDMVIDTDIAQIRCFWMLPLSSIAKCPSGRYTVHNWSTTNSSLISGIHSYPRADNLHYKVRIG